MVFVVGIGSVVGKSGKHHIDDAVDGHDEHVLDLGDELVNADNAVWCKKSEKDHVGLRVHAGGDARDKEGPHGLEVSPYVKFLPRPESNKSMEANHIENVGPVSSEDNYGSVDAVVVRITNEEEHEDYADEFNSYAADGNVSILLNGLVEPFDAEACEPKGNTEDKKQWPILTKSRYYHQGNEVNYEDDGSGCCEDDEEFLNDLCKLFFIVSDLGAGANSVSGNAKHRR